MPKRIHIEKQEMWDETKEEFVYTESGDLFIEHSLYSINLWEEKYHKPFMVKDNKTNAELLDYIRMMTLNSVDDSIYSKLSKETIEEINAYMEDPMTATTFSKEEEKEFSKRMNRFVTAELIYYWMTAENIPFECDRWHINKLLTLIKVCSIENKPEDKKNKKLTQADLTARRAEMEARRAKHHTNG